MCIEPQKTVELKSQLELTAEKERLTNLVQKIGESNNEITKTKPAVPQDLKPIK